MSALSASLVADVTDVPIAPRRPMGMSILIGQASCAAAAAIVLSLCAPLQSRAERNALGTWLPVVSWPGKQLEPHRAPAWLLVLSVGLLVLAWVAVALGLYRRHVPHRLFALGCVSWCTPFIASVPVFSRDAYAYVAQGTLLQRGLDPYSDPVASLGPTTVLRTVDPVWRHTVTPYGPAGLRIEQFAVWVGGGEVGALLALRLVCVVCVAIAGAGVWTTSPLERRQLTLWLLLSPVLLVHLVSGIHLDAVVLAVLALSGAAAVRGHWAVAIGLAVAAGEVKATAFAILPVLFIGAWRSQGRRHFPVHVATALAVGALGGLAYWRDPLGWIAALRTPGSSWDPFTPASTVALVISEVMHHLGLSSPWSVLTVTRVLATVIGGAALMMLLVTARRRSTVETCAWVMLVVLIASPAMWAWYFTAAVPFLLMADRGRMRLAALLLGSAGLLVGLPLKVVPAQRVAVVAEFAAVVVVLAVGHQVRQGRQA